MLQGVLIYLSDDGSLFFSNSNNKPKKDPSLQSTAPEDPYTLALHLYGFQLFGRPFVGELKSFGQYRLQGAVYPNAVNRASVPSAVNRASVPSSISLQPGDDDPAPPEDRGLPTYQVVAVADSGALQDWACSKGAELLEEHEGETGGKKMVRKLFKNALKDELCIAYIRELFSRLTQEHQDSDDEFFDDFDDPPPETPAPEPWMLIVRLTEIEGMPVEGRPTLTEIEGTPVEGKPNLKRNDDQEFLKLCCHFRRSRVSKTVSPLSFAT